MWAPMKWVSKTPLPSTISFLTLASVENPESSDDSDQFVDAPDSARAVPERSRDTSPIPITRVERVDDVPTYGEIPGTAAYKKRSADAVPDEVEVVPDGQRSRSHSILRPDHSPVTPGGSPIPKIIAEKIDPDVPAYGDVPGTAAYEMRKADAQPDEIVRSPVSATAPPNPWNGKSSSFFLPSASSERLTGQGSPTHSIYRSPAEGQSIEGSVDEALEQPSDDEAEVEEGFGDDFDDFEEGQEGDDFGEFDDGFQHQQEEPISVPEAQPQPPPPVSVPQPSFVSDHSPIAHNRYRNEAAVIIESAMLISLLAQPILEYEDLDDAKAIKDAAQPYISTTFPSADAVTSSEFPRPTQQIFLSDRSLSLYTQLTAPPPLAPPNWLRSRIRRLFLVSLGVPVDLDEILPASKQKKLILPSIHLSAGDGRSPRGSTDSRGAPANGAVSRLKGQNDSSASVDSKGNRRGRRKDGVSEPVLDLSEAVRMAGTTDIRLQGMSDAELKEHVRRLGSMVKTAEEVFVFWEKRRDGAVKEKEAFEGVIENLVRHARKVRK
jgi:Domain of unknown function (DUF5102)